jgi:hypothetical protein
MPFQEDHLKSVPGPGEYDTTGATRLGPDGEAPSTFPPPSHTLNPHEPLVWQSRPAARGPLCPPLHTVPLSSPSY